MDENIHRFEEIYQTIGLSNYVTIWVFLKYFVPQWNQIHAADNEYALNLFIVDSSIKYGWF